MVLAVRLSDKLQFWMARAELVARGAEALRRQALEELSKGRPWEARTHAFRLLEEVPDSPLALAVWADAAEAMLLDSEALDALTRLSTVAPFRADVWCRLGQVQERLALDPTESWQAAVKAGEPRDSLLQAVTRLLEAALDTKDLAGAETLAARFRFGTDLTTPLRFRLAELALAQSDEPEAERVIGNVEPEVLDARGWFTWARVAFARGRDWPRVEAALKRAMVLARPPLANRLGEFAAQQVEPVILALLPLAAELDLGELPEWQVARAVGEGEPGRSLALVEATALREKTSAAFQRWLDIALLARDAPSLGRAVDALGQLDLSRALEGRAADARLLLRCVERRGPEGAAESQGFDELACLDEVGQWGQPWASELRRAVYARWLALDSERGWALVLTEVEQLAKAKLSITALNEAASLRLDLERPLRVAVIGEFNAGKSSLINALLGERVAPVGVLPTTATINRLRWAPDRFVRIDYSDPRRPTRVLEYGALEPFLRAANARPGVENAAEIASVSIFSPLEALRQIELIDTPGFNAGRKEHDELALTAASNAHVLLWLLDASAPLKASDAQQLRGVSEMPIPLVVVVNKCDRFAATELDEIMDHVARGLEALGLAPLVAPLRFSARLAESGEHHPSGSGLPELRLLLDTLLTRSVELKARVLGQRTLTILGSLAAAEVPALGKRSAEALHSSAKSLRAGRLALVAEWARELRGSLAGLEREFARVVGPEDDTRRYVTRRAGDLLGQQLFQLVSMSFRDEALVGSLEAALRPRLGALARGLSAGVGFDQGRWRPNADLGASLAALAHGEALEVIEELLAGPSLAAPGSSRAELKHTERCRALDEALRAALSETSYVLETSNARGGSAPKNAVVA